MEEYMSALNATDKTNQGSGHSYSSYNKINNTESCNNRQTNASTITNTTATIEITIEILSQLIEWEVALEGITDWANKAKIALQTEPEVVNSKKNYTSFKLENEHSHQFLLTSSKVAGLASVIFKSLTGVAAFIYQFYRFDQDLRIRDIALKKKPIIAEKVQIFSESQDDQDVSSNIDLVYGSAFRENMFKFIKDSQEYIREQHILAEARINSRVQLLIGSACLVIGFAPLQIAAITFIALKAISISYSSMISKDKAKQYKEKFDQLNECYQKKKTNLNPSKVLC